MCAQQEKGTEEQQCSICGAGSTGTLYIILLVQMSCSNLSRIKCGEREREMCSAEFMAAGR